MQHALAFFEVYRRRHKQFLDAGVTQYHGIIFQVPRKDFTEVIDIDLIAMLINIFTLGEYQLPMLAFVRPGLVCLLEFLTEQFLNE